MFKVLFACVENARRSKIAEAFAKYHAPEFIEAYSAGSRPAEEVDSLAVFVMDEKSIPIDNSKPKSIDELRDTDFDYVITMGCEEECPVVATKRRIEWEIDDPKGKDVETYRRIRNEIESKVINLIEEIMAENIT